MKGVFLIAALAAPLALSGCKEKCTDEVLQRKSAEMQTAMQDFMTKNPDKMLAVTGRLAEIGNKYKTSDKDQMCAAMDEMMAALK